MADVKSYSAYTEFPHFFASHVTHAADAATSRAAAPTARRESAKSVTPPCCVILKPGEDGEPDAAGVALLSQVDGETPRRNVFSVLAVELPEPSALGDYDRYEAVLFEPGVVSFVAALTEIPGQAWAGTLTGISLPFSTSMRVIVRPVGSETGATGAPVLSGSLSQCH